MQISKTPFRVASDQVGLSAQIKTYIKLAKEKSADGLTIAEFSELSVAGLKVAVAACDALSVGGSERKKISMECAAMLFDTLADACVPIFLKPVWWVLRPAARSLCLSLSSGAIEVLLPMIRGER
jgi:hypothetical protein